MKNVYLILAILGFIGPNIFVAMVTVETGNILLWTDPATTFSEMFINKTASAFAVDLLIVVLAFFIWSFREARKHGIKNLWFIWSLTMLLGLAGAFPLFLYLRERKPEVANA